MECKLLNRKSYSKLNSWYYLEIKPIFCQNSAQSKKKRNFHLSVLIATDTLCQCSSTLRSSSPWWESASRSLLDGCSPWSRPSSLRHIFFFSSYSQCFPTKLGKTWWELDIYCCKGSVHCSNHSEVGHCFLQGYFEQNIWREPTISDAGYSLKDQKSCKTSLRSVHLSVSLLSFPVVISLQKSHTGSHRLKEKQKPSTTIQQWWSRKPGSISPACWQDKAGW